MSDKIATRGKLSIDCDTMLFHHMDDNNRIITTERYPLLYSYQCPICQQKHKEDEKKPANVPITLYWKVPKNKPPVPAHAMKIALNDVVANRFKFFDLGVAQGIEYYVKNQFKDLEAPHHHMSPGYHRSHDNPYILFNLLNPQHNIDLFGEMLINYEDVKKQKKTKRRMFRDLPQNHHIYPLQIPEFYRSVRQFEEKRRAESRSYGSYREDPVFIMVEDCMKKGTPFFYVNFDHYEIEHGAGEEFFKKLSLSIQPLAIVDTTLGAAKIKVKA